VILGLLTPVVPLADAQRALSFVARLQETARRLQGHQLRSEDVVSSFRRMRLEQRDLVPPVVTVQTALHPWVAYAILPVFAFANAGVPLADTAIASDELRSVAYGVTLGLLIGKPLGVLAVGALACRLGWCAIPRDVGWKGLALVAVLAGIGFTMAIFIANLAFMEPLVLDTAKVGVLLASCAAAIVALGLGKVWFRATRERSGSAVAARAEQP
jgi:NhaA family Na+:H+ antiporter